MVRVDRFARPFPIVFAAVFIYLSICGGAPGFRDGAHFYAPLFQYLSEEVAAGRLPLWNPYENLGQPLAANPTTMLFYPGTFAAGLTMLLGSDAAGAYTFFVGAHLLLALATTYRLARSWNRSRAASTFAAICYTLSGNILFQWNNVPFLVGAAWFPEAIRQADRMIRTGSIRSAVGLSIVLALTILGGDPQAAYHAILCALVLALFDVRSAGSRRRLPMLFGLFSVAGILTFLATAVQILPAWELKILSDRSLPVHQTAVHHFSVPPWRLVEFFLPDAGGRSFPVNARWFSFLPHDHEIWVPSFYMGLVPALLALSSILFPFGKRRLVPVAFLCGMFLLGSLGPWFVVYPLFCRLPGYDTFRFPAKLLTVAVLFLAILAAAGFDRMLHDKRFAQRFKRIYRVAVGVAVGVAVTALSRPELFETFAQVDARSPLFGPFCPEQARSGLLFSTLCVAASFFIFETTCRRKICCRVLLGLVFFDLAIANSWMLATIPRTEHPDPPPLPARLEQNGGAPIRLYRHPIWYPPEFGASSSPDRPAEARRWDRDSLFPRYTLPWRIAVIDVRGTLMPKDYYAVAGRLRSEMKFGEPGVFERHLEELGVQYVVAPERATFEADPVFSDKNRPGDVVLWKLRNPVERRFVLYEPNRVVFDVSLSDSQTVVVTEQFWPGWRAFDGDREIPIRRVDPAFRGVDLSAGEHRITMVYDPPLFKFGAALSLLGVSAIASFFGISSFRNTVRRKPTAADASFRPPPP